MNKQYLCILMLIPIGIFAQKASPQLLSNAGHIIETSEIKVSWTLGEFAIASIGQNPQLTQGVQQSNLLLDTKVVDPDYLEQVELYPNPTSDILNIKINKNADKLLVKIVDINGKVIYKAKAQETMSIDINGLINGIYILSLSDKNKIVYVSQVIKI